MASSTSTRRVLSDLNVNATLVSTPLNTGGKLFGEVMVSKGENAPAITIAYPGGKRGAHAIEDGESVFKRRKISVPNERAFKSPNPRSSPAISPASPFGATELNDSQNTTFSSLPDNYIYSSSQPQSQSSPLTQEQLRSKARAIRLRLSLASYKVRTNQIDVPISRLEIRSSQSLPQLRRAASNFITRPSSQQQQQRRTALPDKPVEVRSSPPLNTSAPVSPQKMSAGLGGSYEEGRESVLHRQRMGLLNPPFLGREEMGSVAVDGLLSLRRMAN